jgi:hypothetical protein
MRLVRIGRAAVLAAACAALVGCSSQNKDKIEGTSWSCRDQLANGKPFAAGSWTLDFKADGGFAWCQHGFTHTGEYSLGTGDRVTFYFDKPYEGGKKHVRRIRINGDELWFVEPDGRELRFKKTAGPPPK